MLPLWMCLFLCKLTSANQHRYTLKLFQEKELKFAIGVFCSDREAVDFAKEFAARGIGTNLITSSNNLDWKSWEESILSGVAVVVDAKCEFSKSVISEASRRRLFDISRHWIIKADSYYSKNDLEYSAEEWKPGLFNVREFLEDENNEMEHGDLMRKINTKINANILDQVGEQLPPNGSLERISNNFLALICTIDARVDSEVIIAVPKTDSERLLLYEAYKYSLFTKMNFLSIGEMQDHRMLLSKQHMEVSSTNFRNDYNGTLLRAMCALLVLPYYSRTAELTLEPADRFAHIGVEQFILVEEMLNFRGVIKCLDYYGWVGNGVQTGLIRFLHEQKADMMSQGLLLISPRLQFMDFVTDGVKIRLGILVREPGLPQVTNIYVLPFSTEVWVCLIILFLTFSAMLYSQMKTTMRLKVIRYSDITMFITGTSLNQGGDFGYKPGLSARMTLVVFLILSLFLYTSYTANITAFLQSPSNYINSLRDVIESPFTVAVDDVSFQKNLIKEDTSPDMIDLKEKKLKQHGENAFIPLETGVRRVRDDGLAFHCDLFGAHGVINNEFTESEKCELKEILDFSGTLGAAVPKKSPYKEIQKQKYLLLVERGLNSRANKRWSPNEVECQSAQSKYSSVGLQQLSSIYKLLGYGAATSMLIICIEIIYNYAKTNKKVGKRFATPKNMFCRTV